jgi:hypothetical protein
MRKLRNDVEKSNNLIYITRADNRRAFIQRNIKINQVQLCLYVNRAWHMQEIETEEDWKLAMRTAMETAKGNEIGVFVCERKAVNDGATVQKASNGNVTDE